MQDLPDETTVLEFTPRDSNAIQSYTTKVLRLAKAKDRDGRRCIVPLILRYHYSHVRALALAPRDGTGGFVLPSDGSKDDEGATRWLKSNFPSEYHAILMNTLAQLRCVADPSSFQVKIPYFLELFPGSPTADDLFWEALDEAIIADARAKDLEKYLPDELKAKSIEMRRLQ